ncbi:FAD-dependent oxidoreductase [Microseira wollei]|uniref:Monooxygenase, FAD-binding protein n=1 Tax=Microseira wollei NIES-4236 TaxID=2530354 RepID=A0AAV3XPW8_9CYAN|nr:NAD(P)/FAD-dependent oxidoreductase [Microseira wollei]GET42562.1 monooxygenase, FAD-binding protein [Microseira wollei NIES-4236]
MPEHQSSFHPPTDQDIVSSYTGIYDVAIVGAGSIGLATAIGLRQRGIENFIVIDRTRGFRQVGQVLDLLPNGLKALKYLDFKAYEEVKKTAFGFLNFNRDNNEDKTIGTPGEEKPRKTSPEWVQKNIRGQRIRSIPLRYDDWFKDYGEGRVSIPWYDLQTGLRQQLPQDRVKANHCCINVADEPEAGCVRVDFVSDIAREINPYAYWANDTQPQNLETAPQVSEIKSIRAKLVVAADGINSTIRRVLYADSSYSAFAQPEYSGFAAISCRDIPEIPNQLRTEVVEKFFEDSPIVTIVNDETGSDSVGYDPRMMLFGRLRGQLGYIIHLPLPLVLLEGKSESCLIDLALQEMEKAGFPDSLKQLVRLSPPANMQQRPYYIHRATISDSREPVEIRPAWSAGRIVLVGDAAHGMPPFMAQGVNQGFEDALTIATLIANIAEKNHWDEAQIIAKAFEKYEHLRRPLMDYIQQATLTRFPHSSDQALQEYNQRVYSRLTGDDPITKVSA